MIQPPKVPQDKSSAFVDWLAKLVAWAVSERVLAIKGFTVQESARGKTFIPPNQTFPPNLKWQQPDRELNPAINVPKNTLVYISPENPLVTTGLTDLVLGTTVKSVSGVWCSVQNVPAENGSSEYNVPQIPYPGATGTPSGSPLAGDVDGANVFWVQMNGGAGGSASLVAYDTSGATAYSSGQIVYVASQFTLSGITVATGVYMLIGTLSTPATPSGNQIPQIPVPTSGTKYWWPISAGMVPISTCASGSTETVYANSTGLE
jgi:hypothetical protein